MSEGGERLRLFFALWPTPAVRDALAAVSQQLHADCGGRMTRPESIHLTLSFLGEVAAQRLGALESAATDVSGQRFELMLDRSGGWRHNRVAWVGCSEPQPALQSLAASLSARLAPLGFPPETRPFSAHLTLVRKVGRAPPLQAIEAIRWPVEEFVLVASTLDRSGALYEVLRRWPLAA